MKHVLILVQVLDEFGDASFVKKLVLFLGVVSALPMLRLFLEGVAPRGTVELQTAFDTWAQPATQRALLHTLVTAGIGTLISVMLGVSFALLVALTDIRAKPALVFCFMLPLMIAPQVTALAWLQVFGPGSALMKAAGLAPAPGSPNPLHSPGGIALRPATKVDVPIILGLIRGIAEYERLSHEVEATEALLREHGFGPRRIFEAILGERDGQAVAFALYFYSFSTFKAQPTLYLEDLFVVPEERRSGIGSQLLTRLAQIAVERKCGRMEWSVLDWNTPARDFYFKLGAVAMDEWTVFRMTPAAFGALAREAPPGELPGEAV